MTEVRAVPAGMHTITPHIVVQDAIAASGWYQRALEPGSATGCHFRTAR
jgi:hypothetical protein